MKYKIFQAKDVPVKTILDCLSGNSGLTAELVYNTIPVEGKRYEILSSATQIENKLGRIPKCMINNKQIKVFEDKEGLLVIRKGKAGRTILIPPGAYTLNDDAYVLSVKEDCPYKISLLWLSFAYRKEFLSYASSSDNGTWNMTGFFENVKIDIPSFEEQMKVVAVYQKGLDLIKEYLNKIERIKQLLDKQLVEEI